MNIINANELNIECSREKIIEAFSNLMMDKIIDASKKGYHKTCFYISPISYNYKTQSFNYATPKDISYRFDDYRDEIFKVFKSHGYYVRPTGYIGGIWQLSEEIYW